MGRICDWHRDDSCDCFCNGLDISCENYSGDLCTDREKINKIKDAVVNALSKYSTDNVDIVRNEESGMINIIYHSRHNSFDIVSNVCDLDGLSELDIDVIAEYYDIGYCW